MNLFDVFVSIQNVLCPVLMTVCYFLRISLSNCIFLIGKIKIWDLQAALDPRSQPSALCIKTLTEHTGRVFRLQFDEFQIVSSSHDDTILCFNFLQPESNQQYSSTSASVNSSPILGVAQTQTTSLIRTESLENRNTDEVIETTTNVLQTQASALSARSSGSES